MSKSPLVSVYIPTHNRSKILIRAIESVLAQSYKNIEILVCSDGSTDDTDLLMQEYSHKYSNVHYFSHETPKGACAARNVCIKHAKGLFITGLDDDDVFHPDRLKLFVENYKETDAFLCAGYSELELVDFSPSIFNPIMSDDKVTQVSLNDLLFENEVGNQVFTTTEKLRAIDGFCEEMPAWQDYDTWTRLSIKFGLGRKLHGISYIADIDPRRERITTSPKRKIGCFKYYERYDHLMNDLQLKNSVLRKSIFSNKKLPFIELIRCFNTTGLRNWLRAVAIFLGHKF
jgi:glycosyltransferase involved in cell wall biosynthesis